MTHLESMSFIMSYNKSYLENLTQFKRTRSATTATITTTTTTKATTAKTKIKKNRNDKCKKKCEWFYFLINEKKYTRNLSSQ